jgi:hypothetical protein
MGKALIAGLLALSLVACTTTQSAAPDACAGLRKQTITAGEIKRARTDAETEKSLREKVANNEYGEQRGCWKAPR